MPSLKKKSPKPVHVPRARNAHSRQRQRLIEACISALHIYGPSRTTVEKVVAIAKMSPGIVRFYFASKAAMLVASLQFLSSEFEEQLLVPVSRLKSRPVAALELMVDLYLDPEIASPRKVSVWYAFWGEASSRQEYYDICGQKDESFAVLVRELIERLIVDSSQPQLDPDGVALGLIGVLEMLWQDFAFRNEADIDRATAKRRAMAYLRSVFPGQFAGSTAGAAADARAGGGERRPAGWVYANSRLSAVERQAVFQDSWQLAGHMAQLPQRGDFLAVELGIERALVVRDAAGQLRAFRNSCSEAPHALISAASGHLDVIQCAVHGLKFELEDLRALELRRIGDLILVRSAERRRPASEIADPWHDFLPPPGTRPLGAASETVLAADWKLVIEQWLASMSAASAPAQRDRFLSPNHLIESRSDGFTVLQVLPLGAGRSVLRRYAYSSSEAERPAPASPYATQAAIEVMESTQEGIVKWGHDAAQGAHAGPAVAAFRRQLLALVPVLGLARPPNDT